MLLQYKDGVNLIPIGKEQHIMLFSGNPGAGKTTLVECIVQSFLCGENDLFKFDSDSADKILMVDTEQPDDLIRESMERIRNTCEIEDLEGKMEMLELKSIVNPQTRWESIKAKIDGDPAIKVVTLDNLSGLASQMNSDLEASQINKFLQARAEAGILFIVIGHVNAMGSPFGHVGKGVFRSSSHSSIISLNDRDMVCFVKNDKNRLGNLPLYTFKVDKNKKVIKNIYIPFPI